MKAGIPVWGRRISPVFDAARTLLIAEITDKRVQRRQILPCRSANTEEIVRLLQYAGVTEVICGAISKHPATMLEAVDIRVIAFITGKVDQVLDCYADGRPITGYRMPGCGGNRYRAGCRNCDWA